MKGPLYDVIVADDRRRKPGSYFAVVLRSSAVVWIGPDRPTPYLAADDYLDWVVKKNVRHYRHPEFDEVRYYGVRSVQ
jgi:hypothetical protein